jgi:hypothetical protein
LSLFNKYFSLDVLPQTPHDCESFDLVGRVSWSECLNETYEHVSSCIIDSYDGAGSARHDSLDVMMVCMLISEVTVELYNAWNEQQARKALLYWKR